MPIDPFTQPRLGQRGSASNPISLITPEKPRQQHPGPLRFRRPAPLFALRSPSSSPAPRAPSTPNILDDESPSDREESNNNAFAELLYSQHAPSPELGSSPSPPAQHASDPSDPRTELAIVCHDLDFNKVLVDMLDTEDDEYQTKLADLQHSRSELETKRAQLQALVPPSPPPPPPRESCVQWLRRTQPDRFPLGDKFWTDARVTDRMPAHRLFRNYGYIPFDSFSGSATEDESDEEESNPMETAARRLRMTAREVGKEPERDEEYKKLWLLSEAVRNSFALPEVPVCTNDTSAEGDLGASSPALPFFTPRRAITDDSQAEQDGFAHAFARGDLALDAIHFSPNPVTPLRTSPRKKASPRKTSPRKREKAGSAAVAAGTRHKINDRRKARTLRNAN